MKKIILLVFLALPFASFAQTGPGGLMRENRLQSLEIAFLTRELALTPAEAEKFWPVHNKYAEEMRGTMRNKDADVLERQQQMLDIRKKYKPDFNRILSPDRTNRLFEAEVKFREMVKRELQQRRELSEKRLKKEN
jgi:hypothetical protein